MRTLEIRQRVIPSEPKGVDDSRCFCSMSLGQYWVFKRQTQLELISQMSSARAPKPICAICGISDICVGFWNSRDARPLYRDDSGFAVALLRSGGRVSDP